MVRRRNLRSAPAWTREFVAAEWPGRCVVERFDAWRSALAEASQTSSLARLASERAARRVVFREHVDCDVHPPLECWPSSWARSGGEIRYCVAWSSGTMTEETVLTDSPRDVQLTAAYRARQLWPAPSRSAP